jgi:hypothetical protein
MELAEGFEPPTLSGLCGADSVSACVSAWVGRDRTSHPAPSSPGANREVEAIATLDRQFPWLRRAEIRTTPPASAMDPTRWRRLAQWTPAESQAPGSRRR